jgi:hypothetical protein
MGAKLVVGLATNGEPDPYAIDRLIAAFEEKYTPQEKDANLWKAFFRANAEFITLDERILDHREQQRLQRTARPPGASRATRPDDLSSDESDDDVNFDPMVVVRTSAEGRMLGKWLSAARRRMGGEFPRPDARAQMERYAERMRRRKLRGGKSAIAGEGTGNADADTAAKWVVTLNSASVALGQRWLRLAQDSIAARFKSKGVTLRTEVAATVRCMPAEDDWYYGAELRLEGQSVQIKGDQLHQDQKTLEAEEAVKVRKIEVDFESFEREQRAKIDGARREFEAQQAAESDRTRLEAEFRTRELLRTKEEKRNEFEAAEQRAREEDGAASTELLESNRKALEAVDELIRAEQQRAEKRQAEAEGQRRAFFDRKQGLDEQVVLDRRIAAVKNVRRIRQATLQDIRREEQSWQSSAARFLHVGARKVALKKAEDAQDKASKAKKRR